MTQGPARVGIITVSDRASRGEYRDESGPAIHEFLTGALESAWEGLRRLVPDEQAEIESALRELTDGEGCCLVLTTGGTGPAARDVTPEATEATCARILPGFGELMRAVSQREVPTAILSRQTAGLRDRTLIVNLPGKPQAIATCLAAVMPAIADCVALIGGPRLRLREGGAPAH